MHYSICRCAEYSGFDYTHTNANIICKPISNFRRYPSTRWGDWNLQDWNMTDKTLSEKKSKRTTGADVVDNDDQCSVLQ